MLLRCPGPRWPPYQLYHTRCPRPRWPRSQLEQNIQDIFLRRPPGSHICVRRPFGPTHTVQTLIPSCLHQARYIVLGCGSFVRGQKRKKVDSRPFLYHRVKKYGRSQLRPPTRPVSTTQYPNHIYTKPLLADDSIEITEYPKHSVKYHGAPCSCLKTNNDEVLIFICTSQVKSNNLSHSLKCSTRYSYSTCVAAILSWQYIVHSRVAGEKYMYVCMILLTLYVTTIGEPD